MTAKVTINGSSKQKNIKSATVFSNKQLVNGQQFQENCGKPTEVRRANKPLMEKRRRARINQSLAMLKTLILDSAKMDNTKHSKLEKADILELTVRHFQRHRNLDTPGLNKYKAGYTDCVREIQRYLDTPDAQTMTVIDQNTRQRLIRHLDACVSEIDTDISPNARSENISPALDSASRVSHDNKKLLYSEPLLPANNPSLNIDCESKLSVNISTNNQFIETNSNQSFTNTKATDIPASMQSKHLRKYQISQNPAQKVSLEADSSTPAEEINNNVNRNYNNLHTQNSNSEMCSEAVLTNMAATLPNSLFQMPDGSLVFVLPSHYLQLAAALGINLNPATVVPATFSVDNNFVKSDGETSTADKNGQDTNKMEIDKTEDLNNKHTVKVECAENNSEKPLDFSKNNEVVDNMWRPW